MSMKYFYVPECFWQLDNTYVENCDCNKIFFDVMIDFEEYRLILCKDWYVMKVKSIMNGLEKGIQRIDTNVYAYFHNYQVSDDIKDIQASIISYIISNYFKTPIIDKIIDDRDRDKYKRGVQYRHIGREMYFSHNYIVCKRPLIYHKVNVLKFIEFYIYEYKNNMEIQYNRNIYEFMTETIIFLQQLALRSFKTEKLAKIKSMARKLRYDNGDIAIDLVTELLTQFSKLKIKTL